jgi:hypothetical protein
MDLYDRAERIIAETPGLEDAAREVGQSVEDVALELAIQEEMNAGNQRPRDWPIEEEE